ncbi:MAG: site-2 protease family protein [Acidobacteriota bacterium]
MNNDSRKNRRSRQIIVMVVSMLSGGVVGWMGITLAVRIPILRQMLDQMAEALGAADLLLILPIIVLVIFVHELGHLAGGMSQRMRFLLLIVGPFQWTRSATGVRFAWNINPSLMGGLAAATPDRQRRLLPQMLGLVIGGPLASLLLAAGSLALAGELDGRLAALLILTGLMSLLIFLATATPFRAGGMQSDGWQLIELLRGGQGVLERQPILEVMGSSLAGMRPRDWDPETISRLETLASREPLRNIAARVQALYFYWDCGEMARVEPLAHWLADHVDQYPDGFRQAIHLDLAILALDPTRGTDQDFGISAASHAAAASGGIVDPARRQLLAAILAFKDGRVEEARIKISEARRLLARGMDPGVNHFTVDQLDRLAAQLEEE